MTIATAVLTDVTFQGARAALALDAWIQGALNRASERRADCLDAVYDLSDALCPVPPGDRRGAGRAAAHRRERATPGSPTPAPARRTPRRLANATRASSTVSAGTACAHIQGRRHPLK